MNNNDTQNLEIKKEAIEYLDTQFDNIEEKKCKKCGQKKKKGCKMCNKAIKKNTLLIIWCIYFLFFFIWGHIELIKLIKSFF